MILIKNGYIIDPRSGRNGIYDILIQNDKIKRIDSFIVEVDLSEEERNNLQVIYADNMMIAPGLVDVHVHFRDPGFTYKEDIFTGAKAAAKGGFTTVILMANTKPTVDNPDTLEYVISKGKETDIHVLTCASITKGLQGKELTDMQTLKQKGAVGFTDDGIPIMDEEMVSLAMKKAKELNVPLSFHEENPELITNNGINHGKASEYYEIEGSPRAAEIDLIYRDLSLAAELEAPINIQHISTKEGVELVRQKKLEIIAKNHLTLPLPKSKEDMTDITEQSFFNNSITQIIPMEVAQTINIHAEATPHHFSLTEEDTIKHGTMAKMNPPLRTENDRQAIIQGLKDNTIDIIATDHAPHSMEEKAKPITEAPSGIIGLETAFSLGVTNLVKTGYLSYMEYLEKMTTNPAAMYHLDCGYLAEGGPADLIIFNENSYKVNDFCSKSCNSPFKNDTLTGEIQYTICNGKIVYKK
ncbi:MAG: dihydroorotase [Lachnospiraceae bacterium]|nr:dihydroorotase [Lachnospiraceae bacterium]